MSHFVDKLLKTIFQAFLEAKATMMSPQFMAVGESKKHLHTHVV